MNVTLSLDDQLVKKVRKIAVDRDTTLTGLIRGYLESSAEADASSDRKKRQLEALERSYDVLKVNVGKRTWTRADLWERQQPHREP